MPIGSTVMTVESLTSKGKCRAAVHKFKGISCMYYCFLMFFYLTHSTDLVESNNSSDTSAQSMFSIIHVDNRARYL